MEACVIVYLCVGIMQEEVKQEDLALHVAMYNILFQVYIDKVCKPCEFPDVYTYTYCTYSSYSCSLWR